MFERMGKVVTNAQLIEVSGQHNYARRLRELRAEGWDIVYSRNPGGYILRSTNKISFEVDKYINLKLRQKVLERDSYRCQLCGIGASDKYPDGSNVRLEVDHIIPLKQGGKTTEENLWVLCSRCNAGKKSLLAYPETAKSKIISLNLPDNLRGKLSELSLSTGRTVNEVLIEIIAGAIQ